MALALFVLLCFEWARSGYRSDLLWFSFGGGSEYSIRSDWGRLILTTYQTHDFSAPARIGWSSSEGGYADAYPGRPASTRVEHLGVEVTHGGVDWWNVTMPSPSGTTYWRVRMYYPLVLVLVLLPIIPWALQLLRDRRARRRKAAGLCPACGYDLRGSAGGPCPECGTPILSGFAQQPASTAVAAGGTN